MHAKKEKLSLFIFIDAFGWEVAQRHPEFLQGLIKDSKPLETILGYSSACDPSIISGRLPADSKNGIADRSSLTMESRWRMFASGQGVFPVPVENGVPLRAPACETRHRKLLITWKAANNRGGSDDP